MSNTLTRLSTLLEGAGTPIRCARPRNSGAATMAVIWLLYAEAAACDPGEARGQFYGRAQLSQFLTLCTCLFAGFDLRCAAVVVFSELCPIRRLLRNEHGESIEVAICCRTQTQLQMRGAES